MAKQNVSIEIGPPEGAAILDRMAGRRPHTPPTESGARLAALRKAAGLSQASLAESLGIPSRTLCFYERDASYLPSNLLPGLAAALGVSIETVLGIAEGNGAKRGPKSRLEKRLEAVAALPRQEQRRILSVVEALLAQYHHDKGRSTA